MMISELKDITVEDIAVVCNYINDEAKANGVVTDPFAVSSKIEHLLIDKYVEAYKIEDDGVIIAFMVYEKHYHENILAHFYVHPKYRVYRSVMLPLALKLTEEFSGKRLYYKKLHDKVDAITHYANNGEIDLLALSTYVSRLKGV